MSEKKQRTTTKAVDAKALRTVSAEIENAGAQVAAYEKWTPLFWEGKATMEQMPKRGAWIRQMRGELAAKLWGVTVERHNFEAKPLWHSPAFHVTANDTIKQFNAMPFAEKIWILHWLQTNASLPETRQKAKQISQNIWTDYWITRRDLHKHPKLTVMPIVDMIMDFKGSGLTPFKKGFF